MVHVSTDQKNAANFPANAPDISTTKYIFTLAALRSILAKRIPSQIKEAGSGGLCEWPKTFHDNETNVYKGKEMRKKRRLEL